MQSSEKTKPHVPYSGKWGFAYVLCEAFVSHASSTTERFPDQKAIYQPGPKTVKHLTQMCMERQGIWGKLGRRMLEAGYWILDAGNKGEEKG